jgi:putative ABC transport system ATP-binding protein
MALGSEAATVVLLDRVAKTFRSGGRVVAALDGISARIGKGSVTGLIGPDGAGKTTAREASRASSAPTAPARRH